jgi:osmoprotectant transport system permease protein
MERLTSLWEFIASHRGEMLEQTFEHLGLTVIALAIASFIGVSLGITLTRNKKIADNVLGGVGVIQTIPSVALLGFLLPLLGIGRTPAIVALFLYALLPIVRNTFTGIEGVNAAVKEAAKGIGMPDLQILLKVELPLAIPVIFAGVRTATVTTVGVATLCALIASGGLGEFIFRGIALNNVDMILAGAIPAAGLAVLLDFLLGLLQQNVAKYLKQILIGFVVLLAIFISFLVVPTFFNTSFQAAFTSEFMERADGYPGLRKHYDLRLDTVELDPGLMYKALREGQVDVISGFATDGRIKAYNLTVLEDDKNYFPPYYAAPVVRQDTLRKYPELREAFAKVAGKISDEKMAELNYQVDSEQRPTLEVAKGFLEELGLKTSTKRQGNSDIVIGSKNFTEQYILADILAVLIENYTNLDVELKTGLAGTKIAFDALTQGSIDIYPEYTGTGLLVILQPDEETLNRIMGDKDEVLEYVRERSKNRYNVVWLKPFGFNNTYALMMREDEANELDISSISELKDYVE